MRVLITHTDLDGIGCKILSKYTGTEKDWGKVVTTEAYAVDKTIEELFKTEKNITSLTITDCCPSSEMIESFKSRFGAKLYILDHHFAKFNLDKIKREECCTAIHIDETGKESGTSLFARFHILPSEQNLTMMRFIELVRRYDTWQWKELGDIEAKELNQLFYILGEEDFVKYVTEKIDKGEELFDSFAKKILKIKNREIEKYVLKKLEEVIIDTIDNKKVGIVFAEENISELGNKICELKEVDYAAIITGDTVSLRSIGNMDVGKIAIKHGGGGRLNTAGFPIHKGTKNRYIDEVLGMKRG